MAAGNLNRHPIRNSIGLLGKHMIHEEFLLVCHVLAGEQSRNLATPWFGGGRQEVLKKVEPKQLAQPTWISSSPQCANREFISSTALWRQSSNIPVPLQALMILIRFGSPLHQRVVSSSPNLDSRASSCSSLTAWSKHGRMIYINYHWLTVYQ